jgi:hypothetical protein
MLILFLVEFAFSQPTNLTFLETLSDSVFEEIFLYTNKSNEKVIFLKSLSHQSDVYTEGGSAFSGQNTARWFISNRLTKFFFEKGYSVYLSHNLDSSKALVLEYDLIFLRIKYEKVKESSFFKRDKIKRSAEIKIFATLYTKNTEAVIWSGDLYKKTEDILMQSDVKSIEDSDLFFAKGELKTEDGLIKIIESVLIIASLGGIVYLFFMLRST